MYTSRRTAIIVGILFIIGTVSAIVSVAFTESTLSDPNYLSKVAAIEGQMVIGILFWLTMCFALSMASVMLYPILKNDHAGLAVGYVVFRGALETVIGLIMAISQILLILLSQQYAAAGTPNVSTFKVLGDFVLKGYKAINPLLIIAFSLGALMLYYMFYQSKLIPRWISVWGVVAILLHFATAFLTLFHVVRPDDISTLFTINFPIFLQEMVMAVWLIARGFKSPAVTARPTPISFNESQMSAGQ
jgi:hypothetical protein